MPTSVLHYLNTEARAGRHDEALVLRQLDQTRRMETNAELARRASIEGIKHEPTLGRLKLEGANDD
jgi:hypothetical protein